ARPRDTAAKARLTVMARNSRFRASNSTTIRLDGSLNVRGTVTGAAGSMRSLTKRNGTRIVLSRQMSRKDQLNHRRERGSKGIKATSGASQSRYCVENTLLTTRKSIQNSKAKQTISRG